MARKFMEIALTASVLRTQEQYYGKSQPVEGGSSTDSLSEREQTFIRNRNSFYMATINEDGWPYIQHRGGPEGFLKVISPSKLAFADYKGNRQLVSAGNLSQNNRVSLFLIDYPSRARLKIWGTADVFKISDVPEETLSQIDNANLGRTERLFVIDIISFDWNCPQYITPRYSHKEISPIIKELKKRIQELEQA